MHRSNEREDVEYRRHAREHFVEAAKGFHGVIEHPTLFLAGERGSEKVHISPIKSKKAKRPEPPFHMDMAKFDHWPEKQKAPPGFDLDNVSFPEF